MTEGTIGNLGDVPAIPDLSGIVGDAQDPFADGWYAGTILERRAFTDTNGNDRVFPTEDAPAAKSGRNIRLQVVLKRQADGRVLNTSTLINYQPEDLTQESVQAVIAETERIRGTSEKRTNFRGFMTLLRMGTLQRIAGIRQFQRNGHGGLDLAPLYDKTAYFKIGEDDRNPQYKAVKDFSEKIPKKVL